MSRLYNGVKEKKNCNFFKYIYVNKATSRHSQKGNKEWDSNNSSVAGTREIVGKKKRKKGKLHRSRGT